MGIASSIQKKAPPKTSEAVTGAASLTISLTPWRFVNEWPRSGSLNSSGLRPTGSRRPI